MTKHGQMKHMRRKLYRQLLKKSPMGNVFGNEQLIIDRDCSMGNPVKLAESIADECRLIN